MPHPTTRALSLLPDTLQHWIAEIRALAEGHGLDCFDTFFELLPFDRLNEVAAYDGFPTRFPHWRFGMQYDQLAKGYSYGLQKIYELVINNDPCYAYLMEGNSDVAQKLVIAHVFGHCDFFKNNVWFRATQRKAVDRLANHGMRVRRYADKYGLERVEKFLDACLSLENLIDVFGLFAPAGRRAKPPAPADEEVPGPVPQIGGQKVFQPYLERYINPPAFVAAQRARLEARIERQKRHPEQPERDVLAFLLENAPLQPWQHDLLAIVREEAYYFLPQRLTKIMNEGWATYWHSRIMTEQVCDASEIIDYADLCSGTLGTRPGVLNPYKVGLELYRDLEDRWNRGRFGKDYDECDDAELRARWDKQLGLGREKLFEVRALHNDVTFIDTFLTADFCRRQRLFTFAFNAHSGQYEIESREFAKVKTQLLFSLTNCGEPVILVHDANFQNRGELLLAHRHGGVDLQLDYARATLENLHLLWTRPVHLQTAVKGKPVRLSYNGKQHHREELDDGERVEV